MALYEVTQLGNYAFNAFAWPPLAAGIGIALLGWSVAAREKFLGISLTFLLLTSCAAFWLVGFFFVYSSLDPGIAFFWVKCANTAVVFIPSFFYIFSLAAAHALGSHSIAAFSVLLISEFFLISIWGGHFLLGVKKYFWGYYSDYGKVSYLFLLFFMLLSLESFRLFWKCHQRYGETTKRFKTFFDRIFYCLSRLN